MDLLIVLKWLRTVNIQDSPIGPDPKNPLPAY